MCYPLVRTGKNTEGLGNQWHWATSSVDYHCYAFLQQGAGCHEHAGAHQNPFVVVIMTGAKCLCGTDQYNSLCMVLRSIPSPSVISGENYIIAEQVVTYCVRII